MPQFHAVDRTDVTADLGRRLIAEQLPQWSNLPVRSVSAPCG
ncbi:MAG: hypothetical protein ACRDOK_27355 [Streptosporangiaceae bacterium]